MRTRIVEGTTQISSDGNIVFHAYDGDAEFNAQRRNIWQAPTTEVGEYEEIELKIDDSYVPIIYVEETQKSSHKIETDTHNLVTLSVYVESSLRKNKSKKIKFLSNDKKVKVKFNVKKGNPKANDSDGGNINAHFFDTDDKLIEIKNFKDLKYGDSFELEWDKSKNIVKIDFYASDNDWFFDGGIDKVFCGAIKHGSKVGRRLTKNIEALPVAPYDYVNPPTWGSPEASFAVANKYQNSKGMCFAVTMTRVKKAFLDEHSIDLITLDRTHQDYTYSGTTSVNIPDNYFGYGVGGLLASKGYADLLTNEEVWAGKLEEGAMLQFWRNPNNKDWIVLKKVVKEHIGKKREQWNSDFEGGHSVIFKTYIYEKSYKIIALWCYDYSGIEKRFEIDADMIFLGANLKDKK
jgi:hypothetical protein